MIRPMRDEVERYGHYSLAAKAEYDHPFQWGSKRTGPDLARVGGRYSDEWHVEHLIEPAVGGAGIGDAKLCVPGDDPAEGGQCYGRSDVASRMPSVCPTATTWSPTPRRT
jgi:hypothetical protein